MNDTQVKKLKEVLKSEFLPLFVGLRNELKELNNSIIVLVNKDFPEVQKTEITNLQEPIKELVVSNLPDIQKVEVLNQQTEVEVRNIATHFEELKTTFVDSVSSLLKTIVDAKNSMEATVLKVNVENPTQYPQEMKISNLKEIVIPKAEPQASIKISNSSPADAIPVILTSRDRKNFYDAMKQMYIGNDVNMERVVDAINNVQTNIDVDLSTIETLLNDILQALGGQSSGTIKNVFGETTTAFATEDIICSYLVPTGKTFSLAGYTCEGLNDGRFSIYVGATKIWQGRNSWTNRTLDGILYAKVTAGQTIYLKVENLKATTSDFSGTLYGTEL